MGHDPDLFARRRAARDAARQALRRAEEAAALPGGVDPALAAEVRARLDELRRVEREIALHARLRELL